MRKANDKKTIFITGGSSGLGFALAKLYAENDYCVGICGRNPAKLPQNFLTNHSNIQFYPVDVTNKLQIEEALNLFVTKNGQRLDIVVANAGRSSASKKHLPEFTIIEDIIKINVNGVINTFAVAIDIFKRQGYGQLVAIASVAGFVGLPGSAPYSASKAAILAYCESLALELPRYGINVTTIAPGFIDTPLTQQNQHAMPFLMPAAKAAKLIKRAIDKGKVRYVFPLRMKFIITTLAILPRSWYRGLIKLAGYPAS